MGLAEGSASSMINGLTTAAMNAVLLSTTEAYTRWKDTSIHPQRRLLPVDAM
jgi:hypothetical protein